MAYGYDLEAAMQKLPQAIEETETLVTTRCPQVKDLIMEIAKTVNADKLTKVCEAACSAVDGTASSFRQLCGSDGDNMHDGTLHGGLKGAKQINEGMNM